MHISFIFCTFVTDLENNLKLKTMKKIFTTEELIAIMASAKAGGRYVTLTGHSDVNLNKFPTDGSARVRIDDAFKPVSNFKIKFHFGEDYEKKMSAILGCDYHASDANREHLVKNVVMRYKSTGTICLIYMGENKTYLGTTLNGNELTDEETEYMNHYKSKSTSNSAVNYRTISVNNVDTITMNGETYEVMIGKADEARMAG